MEIESIRRKGLRRFFETGNAKGLVGDAGRLRRILLNGNASLFADMAIRFEKAFGVKADTLLRAQTAFELVQARA